MLFLIICILYAIGIISLLAFMAKNYVKMRNGKKNNDLNRQYFFTALIVFFILLGSFIAILLRLTHAVAIDGDSGSQFFPAIADTEGVDLFNYIMVIVLGILLMYIIDTFFRKDSEKHRRPYTRRRLLGILIIIIFIAALMGIKRIMQ